MLQSIPQGNEALSAFFVCVSKIHKKKCNERRRTWTFIYRTVDDTNNFSNFIKRDSAMETKFGVLEVLKIAERLEHNGSRFYTKMAKLFNETPCRNLCEDMAGFRARREITLARQRKLINEQKAGFVPDDDSDYFQNHPDVLADLSVFADKFYPHHALSGHESLSEIVKDAIARTRETVIFYSGLKDFARNQETRALINQFIEEEIRYICALGFKQ